MKTKPLTLILLALVAVAMIFPLQDATATPTPVNLGSASSFAVLAGSAIAVTGPTTITGDIGTYPTPSISGLGNVTFLNGGVDRTGNAGDMLTAKNDLGTAYDNAAGQSHDVTYAAGFDLVGLTLTSGVYNDPTSFGLTGTLTLNAAGNPNAIWVFQAGSTLTTTVSSHVILENGAQAKNVFWQVGTSATLGRSSSFEGNILADVSITLDTGVTVDGRLLARTGAVTLAGDTISAPTVPDTGSTLLLLGSGLATLFAFRRRSLSLA